MAMTSTAPNALAVSPRRAWQALSVLLIGMFMSLLDATIVNVALPTIRVLSGAAGRSPSVLPGRGLGAGAMRLPVVALADWVVTLPAA